MKPAVSWCSSVAASVSRVIRLVVQVELVLVEAGRVAEAAVLRGVEPQPGTAGAGVQLQPVVVIAARFHRHTARPGVGGRSGDEVDQAVQGVGAVQGAAGSPDNFHRVRLFRIELE